MPLTKKKVFIATNSWGFRAFDRHPPLFLIRAYDRQTRKGKNYDVPPVYLIGLMDVDVEHHDKEFWKNRFVSEYTFREKECHDLLGETIVIIFAEMANFRKEASECVTETDKMLYLLKNIGRMMNQPPWLQHEVYTRIFRACEIAGFTEDKLIKYEKEMYDEKRRNSEMNTARRIGYENGLKAGISDGRAEGRAIGLAEGRSEAQVEMARNLLNLGVDRETIIKATGLDEETLDSIA